MRTWIARALIVPIALVAAYLAVPWVMQESLLFQIPGGIDADQLDLGASEYGATPFRVRTADAEHLYGWHRQSGPGRSPRLLVYFHGETETIAQAAATSRILADDGWDVLTVAFRGYPGSTGKPSEKGLGRDADAIWKHATQTLGFQPNTILFHGRGLGAAVAADLATRTNPAGLVLESTFSSLSALVNERAPFWPTRWLLRHQFPTDTIAPQTGVPVLLMHGTLDQAIPVHHSRQLTTKFAEASLLTTEQGHGPHLILKDADLRDGYLDFLGRCVPAPDEQPSRRTTP